MDEPASARSHGHHAGSRELILEPKRDYTIVIVTHTCSRRPAFRLSPPLFYLGELVEFGTSPTTTSSHRQTEDYVTTVPDSVPGRGGELLQVGDSPFPWNRQSLRRSRETE